MRRTHRQRFRTLKHVDKNRGQLRKTFELLQRDSDLLDDETIVDVENRFQIAPVLICVSGQMLLHERPSSLCPVAPDVSPTDERRDPSSGTEKVESLVHQMFGTRATGNHGAPRVFQETNAPVIFVGVGDIVRKVSASAPSNELFCSKTRLADKERTDNISGIRHMVHWMYPASASQPGVTGGARCLPYGPGRMGCHNSK